MSSRGNCKHGEKPVALKTPRIRRPDICVSSRQIENWVEIVGSYQDDVRKIEVPPYLSFAAASTPGFPVCGGGSVKGVCLDGGEFSGGTAVRPVERVDCGV
jgi:hypothetical protein